MRPSAIFLHFVLIPEPKVIFKDGSDVAKLMKIWRPGNWSQFFNIYHNTCIKISAF
jgi:hypothetical protein